MEHGQHPLFVMEWPKVSFTTFTIETHVSSALELSPKHLQSQHWIFRPVTLTSIPTPVLPQDRPRQQTHILYESEKFQ